jgi:hypothetical protein
MIECFTSIRGLCWVGLVMLSACKPTIHSFRADPNVACPSAPVRLTWSATSGGEISATPAVDGMGSVSKSGSTVVMPTGTTRFHLASSNLWGTASRDIDVDVRAVPSDPKPIGASVGDLSASPRCEGKTLSVAVVAPPASWDEHLLVAAIELPRQVIRHYHVEHAGISAELDPGSRSTAFERAPVRGTWLLSTALEDGEACGSNVPLSLLINVYAGCNAAGTQ